MCFEKGCAQNFSRLLLISNNCTFKCLQKEKQRRKERKEINGTIVFPAKPCSFNSYFTHRSSASLCAAVRHIQRKFPRVTIATTEVHPVNPNHFGQKYFGTD